MPRFEASVVIDRSPQEVFDYITDPTHIPEWIEEIQLWIVLGWRPFDTPMQWLGRWLRMPSRFPDGSTRVCRSGEPPRLGAVRRRITCLNRPVHSPL